MLQTPFEAMLTRAALDLGQQFVGSILTDPSGAMSAVEELGKALGFSHCHTGYNACQDILDACEHGYISHEAAMTAIAALMSDMQRRGQKPV